MAAVTLISLAALAAVALGASIALADTFLDHKFGKNTTEEVTLVVPSKAPPSDVTVKTSRIVRNLMRVSSYRVVEKSECGRVWLTVHSPALRVESETLLDVLELNWDFTGCSNIPQQIGIFKERPQSWHNVLEIYQVDDEEGYIITGTPLRNTSLPGNWENGVGHRGSYCLWPWVGAGSGDRITACNCLKIQPSWMEDNAAKINHLRIGELAIPGSHNAGAWKFNTELSNVSRDSFVLCQDRSIWAQLVHGIRYFDFRIAYYDFYPDEEDRYWLNHNLIRVRPLLPLLQEIREFLDNSKEVIFLDAHHFPVGFYNQDGSLRRGVHNGLLRIVQREFGPHLALAKDFATSPGLKGPTLQALLDADKRLLFSYVDNAIVAENNWLWPILPHLWANTNNPETLFQYLDQAITVQPQPNARSPLHSAMAQTTPTVLDILFLRGSLRENADAVNRNVTARLMTRWRKHANIIASDFFQGNDVIDVSIKINVERGARL